MAVVAAGAVGLRGADLLAAARVRVRRGAGVLRAGAGAAPAVAGRRGPQVGQSEPGPHLPSGTHSPINTCKIYNV